MSNKNKLYAKLQAQKERNKELTAEINRLDDILNEKRAEEEIARREWEQLQNQYQAIRNSVPWRGLRVGKKLLKNMRKYGLGRRHIRRLKPAQKMRQAKKQIDSLKYKLELGFTDKALDELKYAFRTTDNSHVERYAAWELGQWFLNQGTCEDARQSLEFLEVVVEKENDVSFLCKAAIMKAEAYSVLKEFDKGMQVLKPYLEQYVHPDVFLAASNLSTSSSERVKWMNKALELKEIAPIRLQSDKSIVPYDCLACDITPSVKMNELKQPKVTVIVPVYNGAAVINTALGSLIDQTWKYLEIIVVDDCSIDETPQAVKKLMQMDERITLLDTPENSGPYIARNIALQKATGEFVTVNDADDWSHPDKIHQQVVHLNENKSIMANTTEQVRMTEDLTFYRRGQAGKYIFSNMSSLMFRREPVMKTLGYWDAVRFGADGELKRRMIQAFGGESVVDLHTGPYSFTRQSSGSLTGSSEFGYHGFFVGARKEYAQSHQYYHGKKESLYYPQPMKYRPFPVPEPMWPLREVKQNGFRHFDVIIASEFRLLGGTNMSNIEEIKAQQKMGLKTGLLQMNRYDFTSIKQINPEVRAQINGEDVQMLVYGENVSCDVLIVRHPPVLQEWQKYLPEIDAKNVRVIINQAPMRAYGQNSYQLYDIKRCAEHIKQYTGKIGKWYPIGPSIREAIMEYHQKDLHSIKLANDDWVNIINIEEWRRPSRPKHDGIWIGRHSRDQYVKWPSQKEELLEIYPGKAPYEIHVLGGASAPKEIMGDLPDNWVVHPFGEVEPRDFLRDLDVFVYYTHPDWVEAFGRVIFEAMATGVPVIIPSTYKALFGDAAIYAEPEEVQQTIEYLMQNEKVYDSYVKRAWTYVENQFGYTRHASRLMDGIVKDLYLSE